MHYAALVSVPQCAGHIPQGADSLSGCDRSSALEPPTQRFSFNERHHKEWEAIDLARAYHTDDMWVLQPCHEHDLALEPVDGDTRGEIARQHLYDHPAPQRIVHCDEHARHATAAEFPFDGEVRS
ncbi:MAG: hypothetical protein AMS21_06100 [Gemmatimonas sp. SG8_38_2]|nr:MAG: hypothetical protein AMS21_06100 [Gemmatimonas sp. SG8_38_2]